MDVALEFIGIVHSPLKKLEDCPRLENENAPPATLHIFPGFEKAAKHLKVGAEIIVLTWLHKADRKTLETYPRNNTQLPLTGVFATRSPDRPNPIGLHIVTIVEKKHPGEIKVSGLDTLDQTPILDIKPVLNR